MKHLYKSMYPRICKKQNSNHTNVVDKESFGADVLDFMCTALSKPISPPVPGPAPV
jgi:hypothetical protein